MVSVITAWGVGWTGLPHSPKTDSDRLMKDNQTMDSRLQSTVDYSLRTVTAPIVI